MFDRSASWLTKTLIWFFMSASCVAQGQESEPVGRGTLGLAEDEDGGGDAGGGAGP